MLIKNKELNNMTNIRKALDQFKSSHHTYRKFFTNAVEIMYNKKHGTEDWHQYVSSNINLIIQELREVNKSANSKSLNYSNQYSYAKKFREEGARDLIKSHSNKFRLQNPNAKILKDVYK